MANGEATVSFDGINLDNCIEQGLELIGYAKCPHCRQVYTYRIHLSKKDKKKKYTETLIDGKSVTTLVPDSYETAIEFAKYEGDINVPDLSTASEDEDNKPCEPCSQCTRNCKKLGY